MAKPTSGRSGRAGPPGSSRQKSAKSGATKSSKQRSSRSPKYRSESGSASRSEYRSNPRQVRSRDQTEAADLGPGERLQKVLAQIGMGSRREIEKWITEGRVIVNGDRAVLGQRVKTSDKVEVDGERVRIAVSKAVEILILNKATGVVTTRRDPEGRTTVYEELPDLKQGRWVSVGRLDVQTSGLLLFTNDGELANRLMHPSTGLDREYAVRIHGILEKDDIDILKAGIEVDGETLRFSDVRFYNGSGSNNWYHVVLTEGRNREVRRLFESRGLTVSRLKRVRYGPFVLPSWLRNGQWASLQQKDVRNTYKMLGMSYETPKRTPSKVSRTAKTSCLIPYPKLEKNER
ncbi:MAG: pseudouridine synthase [Pseudomonadales bacterium]|nr:pseudouridine synthase [Pseudomonadales bacterium]